MIRSLELRSKRSAVKEARRRYEEALRDDDFLEILQFEGVPELLEEELRLFEAEPVVIGEALFSFGGGTYHARFGLDLAVVNDIISSFQRLVACEARRIVASGEAECAGLNPQLPLDFMATIYGASGVLLRERAEPEDGRPSVATLAIHRVATLVFEPVAAPDLRQNVVDRLDGELKHELETLLAILDNAKASMSIIEGDHEHTYSVEAIHRARVHASGAEALAA